jgi:peptidoglycan/LPS O-acetylase OafA/YrhL
MWYYFAFLQNIAMGVYKTFGPNSISVSWSLAVEEQFYLVIPLLIYFIHPRNYKYVIAAGMLMALIARATLPNFYQHYTWLICRMDAPLTGFLVAVAMQYAWFKDFLIKRRKWIVAAACLCFIVTLAGHAFAKLGFINHTLSAINFGIILVIVLSIEKGIFYKLLTNPFLLLMGKVSFFFYLFHQLVNGLAHLIILGQKTPMLDSGYAALLNLACFGFTLGAGILSFKYFEGPLIKYSHKFRY